MTASRAEAKLVASNGHRHALGDTAPAGITSGVCEITIETRSPVALAEFYRAIFGWPELSREQDRIWLGCGERSRIGLWTPGDKEFGDRGGRHVHFALSVHPGQLDQLVARLQTLGLSFTGPVEHDGGDRSVYFRDPEDNLVEAWDFFQCGPGARRGIAALT
jgi:catechol-2,3-dioxygenase